MIGKRVEIKKKVNESELIPQLVKRVDVLGLGCFWGKTITYFLGQEDTSYKR